MPVLEPLQALSGSYETIFAKSGRIGDLEITGDITEVTNVTAVGNLTIQGNAVLGDADADATTVRTFYIQKGGYKVNITHSASADRVITLPDATDTLATLGQDETFTGVKSFSATPKMDSIAELTTDAGVTIDGLLIKDGKLLGKVTIPDVTDTLAVLGTEQTFTAIQKIQVADKSQLYLMRSASEGASLLAYGAHGQININANAYYDGTDWYRFNTSYPLWTLILSPNTDALRILRAPAGTNPASLSEIFLINSSGRITKCAGVDASGSVLIDASLHGTPIGTEDGIQINPAGYYPDYIAAVSSDHPNINFMVHNTSGAKFNFFKGDGTLSVSIDPWLDSIIFGSSGDVNLYRVDADKLKTDDWFIASRVGIGLDSPEQHLHIYGGNDEGILIESSGDWPSIYLKGYDGTNKWTTKVYCAFTGKQLRIIPEIENVNAEYIFSRTSTEFSQYNNATETNTILNPPCFSWKGRYWDGASSQDFWFDIVPEITDTTPHGRFKFKVGGSDVAYLTDEAHFNPPSDGAGSLGESSLRWGAIYTTDLDLKSPTDPEAHFRLFEKRDGLYLKNVKTGKVYRILMEEVN